MDNFKEFQRMLDKAIEAHPQDFKDFDRTKNVQDQLQEMVDRRFDWTKHRLFAEYFEYTTDYKDSWIATASMEQLWLAFAMKEKYNKIWDGEEWIK